MKGEEMKSALRFIESLDIEDIGILSEFFQQQYGLGLEYSIESYCVLECWSWEKITNE
jgi:hypothetical protein